MYASVLVLPYLPFHAITVRHLTIRRPANVKAVAGGRLAVARSLLTELNPLVNRANCGVALLDIRGSEIRESGRVPKYQLSAEQPALIRHILIAREELAEWQLSCSVSSRGTVRWVIASSVITLQELATVSSGPRGTAPHVCRSVNTVASAAQTMG